jgi:hypothetical protein
MKGSLWTVAVLACALVLAVPLVNAAAQTTGINESVSETATVDYTQNYTLANNDSQSFGELTVDNSSGVRLTNGSEADYLFNRNDGTIEWDSTTKTSSGEVVTINYTYQDQTERQDAASSTLLAFGEFVGFLLLVAGMGYLVILMVGGSGF